MSQPKSSSPAGTASTPPISNSSRTTLRPDTTKKDVTAGRAPPLVEAAPVPAGQSAQVVAGSAVPLSGAGIQRLLLDP